MPLGSPLSTIGMAQKLQHCSQPGRSPLGMRGAMDLISLIGMAQSIQHCGHMNSECKLGFEKVRMPGVEPGSQAWQACIMSLHYVRVARFIRFLAH
jgi:hypothetical protein